jgi:hypothetical protein
MVMLDGCLVRGTAKLDGCLVRGTATLNGRLVRGTDNFLFPVETYTRNDRKGGNGHVRRITIWQSTSR